MLAGMSLDGYPRPLDVLAIVFLAVVLVAVVIQDRWLSTRGPKR